MSYRKTLLLSFSNSPDLTPCWLRYDSPRTLCQKFSRAMQFANPKTSTKSHGLHLLQNVYEKRPPHHDHRTAPNDRHHDSRSTVATPPPSQVGCLPPFPRQHDTAKGSSHNGRRRTAPLTYTSPSSSSLTASSGSISCGTSSTTALSSQLVFRVLRFVF